MNRNEFQKAAKLFRAGRLTLDEFTAQALQQNSDSPADQLNKSLSVYLFFDGQCREAFEHYKKVFDAEELCVQTFADGPAEMFGNEPQDRIMHTTLRIGETMLMGSDHPENCGTPPTSGRNFSISYRPESQQESDRIFALLADGGTVDMPLQVTFWGSYFGQCTDKFGIQWMFNCPVESAPA